MAKVNGDIKTGNNISSEASYLATGGDWNVGASKRLQSTLTLHNGQMSGVWKVVRVGKY